MRPLLRRTKSQWGRHQSVRIGAVAASNVAQFGPVNVVTVDANETLSRQAVATAGAIDSVRLSMNHIAAGTEKKFGALDDRVGLLESGLADVNFRLGDLDQARRGGVAANRFSPEPSPRGLVSSFIYPGVNHRFHGARFNRR